MSPFPRFAPALCALLALHAPSASANPSPRLNSNLSPSLTLSPGQKRTPPGAPASRLNTQILVSVADQRLALVRDGVPVASYPVSTSRYGLGDRFGSYTTPKGHLAVAEKIGGGAPMGAVFKSRRRTGEVLHPNAPGRDPIVTRILWLRGVEAATRNAFARKIYIHGTPQESLIGRPASYGCIRMRSRDVIELFEKVPVGTPVNITTDALRRALRSEGA